MALREVRVYGLHEGEDGSVGPGEHIVTWRRKGSEIEEEVGRDRFAKELRERVQWWHEQAKESEPNIDFLEVARGYCGRSSRLWLHVISVEEDPAEGSANE